MSSVRRRRCCGLSRAACSAEVGCSCDFFVVAQFATSVVAVDRRDRRDQAVANSSTEAEFRRRRAARARCRGRRGPARRRSGSCRGPPRRRRRSASAGRSWPCRRRRTARSARRAATGRSRRWGRCLKRGDLRRLRVTMLRSWRSLR